MDPEPACNHSTKDFDCQLADIVNDDNPIAMLMRILIDNTYFNIENAYGDIEQLGDTLLWDIHRATMNGITMRVSLVAIVVVVFVVSTCH